MNIVNLLTCCFLLSFHLHSTAQNGFTFNTETDISYIPFEIKNGLLIIKAKVENGQSINLIVDTGVSSLILFDSEHLKGTGSKPCRKMSVSGFGEGAVTSATVYEGVRVDLPGVRGINIFPVVLNSGKRFSKLTHANGMIGYQLFSRFKVELNYSLRIMTLYSGDFNPGSEFNEIPLQMIGAKPHIRARLQQRNGETKQALLMVDTGCAHELFLPESGNHQKRYKFDSGYGLSGEIKGWRTSIPQIQINQIMRENILAFIYSTKRPALQKALAYRDGNIGNTFLLNFSVIFDYAGEKLYLKPVI